MIHRDVGAITSNQVRNFNHESLLGNLRFTC
jgi:hypothetical protein